MMRTIESIRAKLRARLHDNESFPPFTAIETLICEEIDRLAHIARKQDIVKSHDEMVFEEKIKS